jgi:hypothetical protein
LRCLAAFAATPFREGVVERKAQAGILASPNGSGLQLRDSAGLDRSSPLCVALPGGWRTCTSAIQLARGI